jgi:hypothetical protein
MIRPNENPLIPGELGGQREQGADAKALGPCDAEHSPLVLALSAIDAAREQLGRYALATDDPLPGVIDAADWIDAAMLALSAELNRERIFAGSEA